MLYTKYYRQPELLYAVWTLWIKNIFSLDKWTQLNCRFHNVVIELIELKVSGSGSPSFFFFFFWREGHVQFDSKVPIWIILLEVTLIRKLTYMLRRDSKNTYNSLVSKATKELLNWLVFLKWVIPSIILDFFIS